MPRALQLKVRPRLTAIIGAVHAVSPRRTAHAVRLARSDPHHRIRRRQRDGADRHRCLTLENRLPGDAGVRRLPDAARRSGDVDRVGMARDDGDVDGPATGGGWPNRAPVECLQPLWFLRRRPSPARAARHRSRRAGMTGRWGAAPYITMQAAAANARVAGWREAPIFAQPRNAACHEGCLAVPEWPGFYSI